MYVDPDPECDTEGWGTARSSAVGAAGGGVAVAAYVAVYGVEAFFGYVDALGGGLVGVLAQFLVLAGVVLAHEAVHALAYATVGGLSPRDIELHVGVERSLDPIEHSVHPGRPIRRSAYYLGLAAPTVVLGVVPTVLALATGSALAAYVGAAGMVLVSTDVPAFVEAWRHPDRIAAGDPAY